MRRRVSWGIVVLVAMTCLLWDSPTVIAARLRPEAIAGWGRYVAAVEDRHRHEMRQRSPFLVLDTGPDRAAERRSLVRGEFVVREMRATGADGRPIEVAGAMVHHWRGAVFLPGATLASLLTSLEHEAPRPGRDVLRSAILDRGPSFIRLFLRLERTKLVTVVLDTEHDVRFARLSSTRASSTSVATRIVEVEAPGTAAERRRPAGDDRGFLWRLNAYWRYEAAPNGVIAECESISLSRSVPFGLELLAQPLIGSAARESMEQALDSLRDRPNLRPSPSSLLVR
jgi:hypothetical protein